MVATYARCVSCSDFGGIRKLDAEFVAAETEDICILVIKERKFDN